MQVIDEIEARSIAAKWNAADARSDDRPEANDRPAVFDFEQLW